MKNYQRYQQLKKVDQELHHRDDDDDEVDDDDLTNNPLGVVCGDSSDCNHKRGGGRPILSYFLFLSFLSCCLVFIPQFLSSASSCSFLCKLLFLLLYFSVNSLPFPFWVLIFFSF